MNPLRALYQSFLGWRAYMALPAAQRAITFYSEDIASWAFLGPMVRHLTGELGREVAYLTSSPEDPRLKDPNPRLRALYLGEGLVRTIAFFQLPGPVVVMTMPDLENLYLKRSQAPGVHYVYAFHSMVSSHMIYRPGAFDHYDTVLCVGPHHVDELTRRAERAGRKPPNLVPHGYARLDTILASAPGPVPPSNGPPTVVVAPSWGPHGLIETRGVEVTQVLLDAGYEVVVRPHPHTLKTAPESVELVRKQFKGAPRFTLELDTSTTESLARSAVMLSDWSGAALDFAFGYARPVVFLDVPRKVNDPDYEALGIEPFEVSVREKIGRVVAPDALDSLPAVIEELLGECAADPARLASLREASVFHLGESGRAGAEAIVALLDD